jgi:hypothetical protein
MLDYNDNIKLQIQSGKKNLLVIDIVKFFEIKGKYAKDGWTFKGIKKFIPNLPHIPDNMEIRDWGRAMKFKLTQKMDRHILKQKLGHRFDIELVNLQDKRIA